MQVDGAATAARAARIEARRAALALALILVVAAGSGQAQPLPAPAREEAGARFQRALRLFEAGDTAAALAEFQQAHRLSGRWELLLNIGVCQKRLFRYGEAVQSLERYLAEGRQRVPAEQAALVRRELAEIRALVAEVTVVVDGPPAELELDGRSLGPSPLAGPLLVGPGPHVLVARREGAADDRRAVDAVAGGRFAVRLAPRARRTTATLAVETRPAGAHVAIDGNPVGAAPWRGSVAAGGHEVSATLAGFHRARAEVLLVADQARQVSLELVALPPPPATPRPWYRRWYLYAGVAAVVTGTVLAAYFGTRSPGYDARVTYP